VTWSTDAFDQRVFSRAIPVAGTANEFNQTVKKMGESTGWLIPAVAQHPSAERPSRGVADLGKLIAAGASQSVRQAKLKSGR